VLQGLHHDTLRSARGVPVSSNGTEQAAAYIFKARRTGPWSWDQPTAAAQGTCLACEHLLKTGELDRLQKMGVEARKMGVHLVLLLAISGDR
jgi:hypothetical protein